MPNNWEAKALGSENKAMLVCQDAELTSKPARPHSATVAPESSAGGPRMQYPTSSPDGRPKTMKIVRDLHFYLFIYIFKRLNYVFSVIASA
jgi:hypothetical protein